MPGSSPVHYASNSADHLFIIEYLTCIPIPVKCRTFYTLSDTTLDLCCLTLSLPSQSRCGIEAQGRFKTNLSNSTHLSFNITTHFDDGRTGGLCGEDDLRGWVDVVQNDTEQYPPREGNATVT